MSVVCRLTEGPIRPACGKRKHMTGTKPNTLLSITLPQQSPTSLTHIHNHYKYWCRRMGVYGEQSDMWNMPTTNFLKGVVTYLFIIIYFCLKIAEITPCILWLCCCIVGAHHHHHPLAGRRMICRLLPGSSRCSHALSPCVGGACGRAAARSSWPLSWRSEDSLENWTSSGLAWVPAPPHRSLRQDKEEKYNDTLLQSLPKILSTHFCN